MKKNNIIIFLSFQVLIGLISCEQKSTVETINNTSVETPNKIPSFEEPEINLTLEQINYGAQYCLSVAEQMKENAIKYNCKVVNQLLINAIDKSKISINSSNLEEAYHYFKEAEKDIKNANDLIVDCNQNEYKSIRT
jgi:hypothetical protein